jgi:hypothetical protein
MSRIKTRELTVGIILLTSFAAVMVMIFMPWFDGGNALNYLDNLYNTISKGSAYYIPKVQHEVEAMAPTPVSLELELGSAETAERARTLLAAAGAEALVEGDNLTVRGDLRAVFASCIEDADAAYHNRGEVLAARYGEDARTALHAWWRTLGAIERDLTRQRRFDAAKTTHAVQAKAVECAYNYFGIEAQKIRDRWGTVLFSLVFYVLYTVWYGYGIMLTFEGLGFELTAH